MTRLARRILTLMTLAISSLIFTNQAVFADSTLSITLSTDTVNISLAPGQFGTVSQTIIASTSSEFGYQVRLTTTGSSSALVHQTDNTKTIPTFTLPGGSTSIPAGSLGDGYGYSVDNGANFYPIPEPSASSVELFRTTTDGSNNHTLTFGAKVPMTAIAGTYSNTFDIMIVANPEICPAENICYDGNGDDGNGTMSKQPAGSNSDVTLIASNYSRPGYGFAGWNTANDGTGTNYGPNEDITTGDLSSEGLQLYARWIQSAGNLQGWNGCDSLSVGGVTALTDTRDGNTYAVAKYVDGQCWMMETLRLDLSSPTLLINNSNTNNPTIAFANTINNNHPASTNNFCANTTAAKLCAT